MAEGGPALLRQLRLHGLKQPHQDVPRFPYCPPVVGRWLSLEAGERGLEGIRELVDVGDADVEAEPFDVFRDARERAVGGLAQGERRLAEARRSRQIGGGPPPPPPPPQAPEARGAYPRPPPPLPPAPNLPPPGG